VTVDATGKTLFPAYGVKSFKGHGIAFIGMTLKDTPTIVTPAGVAGLTFKDEAETVNGLIPELRRHGVRVIVVLVHQGASAAVSDINGCISGAGKIPSRPSSRSWTIAWTS
jgi:5'-nucleotidase